MHRPTHLRVLVCLLLMCALRASPAGALALGELAPPFRLTAATGARTTLTELTSTGPVVIYTFLQAASAT